MATGAQVHDYYELLQISPNADSETIHRVYRFLATRLHPDNNETGQEERFRLLKTAYDVLADPRRRKEYDMDRARTQVPPEPLAATIDFMDANEGEMNRRLAVLAVLYHRRRTNPIFPDVPLSEIEERMGSHASIWTLRCGICKRRGTFPSQTMRSTRFLWKEWTLLKANERTLRPCKNCSPAVRAPRPGTLREHNTPKRPQPRRSLQLLPQTRRLSRPNKGNPQGNHRRAHPDRSCCLHQ